MSQPSASTAAPSPRTTPPFRADHVGSLLRPDKLKQARETLLGAHTSDTHLGPHGNEALRAVEDACIRDLIAMQQRVGLKAATDGELRRRSWWLEMIMTWSGFAADRTGLQQVMWRNEAGPTQGFSQLAITGPVAWQPSAVARAFAFLQANTSLVAKVTLPAPSVVHYFVGGSNGIRASAYRDPAPFWQDVIAAYRQELAALVQAGARYIQLDDTSIAFLCDPLHREYIAACGDDPDQTLDFYADITNAVLQGLPPDVTVTFHQCRGNREGNWAAEGGYDPVADVLFNRIAVNGYFLEYDTARAGGFEPLRLLPKGKTLVLGLVSSKRPQLEPADTLVRRIEEAARFAPIEQLALSPQCGFASSVRGNPLTEAEQEAKLARIVEVAHRVWGGV